VGRKRQGSFKKKKTYQEEGPDGETSGGIFERRLERKGHWGGEKKPAPMAKKKNRQNKEIAGFKQGQKKRRRRTYVPRKTLMGGSTNDLGGLWKTRAKTTKKTPFWGGGGETL